MKKNVLHHELWRRATRAGSSSTSRRLASRDGRRSTREREQGTRDDGCAAQGDSRPDRGRGLTAGMVDQAHEHDSRSQRRCSLAGPTRCAIDADTAIVLEASSSKMTNAGQWLARKLISAVPQGTPQGERFHKDIEASGLPAPRPHRVCLKAVRHPASVSSP